MAKYQNGVAAEVRRMIEPTAAEQGISVWDVEYLKEGAYYFLRITIDSEKGIDIDDCERFHRAIDPILDEADPIEGEYRLEVSSPGIERDIRLPEHYQACVGKPVCVRLFKALDGRKMIVGTLLSYDEEKAALSENGKTVEIPASMISKANIYYDYDTDPEGLFKKK